MADAGLFISWGGTELGRDDQGVRLRYRVPNPYYASLLEAGRISRHEPSLTGHMVPGLPQD